KPEPTGPIPRAQRPVHLPALVSFECVARHLSFVRAAEELDVTTTAISKRSSSSKRSYTYACSTARPGASRSRGRDATARHARTGIGSDSRFGTASRRFLRAPTWPAAHQHRVRPVRCFD